MAIHDVVSKLRKRVDALNAEAERELQEAQAQQAEYNRAQAQKVVDETIDTSAIEEVVQLQEQETSVDDVVNNIDLDNLGTDLGIQL
jgi:hypothetical protein